MERLLILEDGTVFKGKAFGAKNNVFGEIVFTTSYDRLSRNDH